MQTTLTGATERLRQGGRGGGLCISEDRDPGWGPELLLRTVSSLHVLPASPETCLPRGGHSGPWSGEGILWHKIYGTHLFPYHNTHHTCSYLFNVAVPHLAFWLLLV